MISKKIKKAVEHCIERNIPFAMFAEPGETDFQFIASLPDATTMQNDHSMQPGGIGLTMFDDTADYAVVINPDYDADSVLKVNIKDLPDAELLTAQPTSPVGYLAEIHEAVSRIKSQYRRKNAKVIISRMICGTSCHDSVTDICERYFADETSTFRILYFTQETGLWITSTPEVLLDHRSSGSEQSEGNTMVMSLAGTKPLADADTPWSTKNINEQLIVTEWIRQTICNVANTIPREKTYDRKADYVLHLCTEFRFDTTSEVACELACALHPTPAVCGWPREFARTVIADLEPHRRNCYTGTITYARPDINDSIGVYVNLRCAMLSRQRLDKNHVQIDFNIYVGGGITADSVAADEWLETNHKARKLLDALVATPQLGLISLDEAIDTEYETDGTDALLVPPF